MNDSSLRKCPTCGAALDAEGGLGCPRCLMLAALQPTRHTEGAERPPPPSLAAVSAAFPQLEVLELIGQGGMGCVFKARQPQLNRFVALKILPEALSRDAAFAGRFTREAQALAALSHPNIVTIHDFGQTGRGDVPVASSRLGGDADRAVPRFFYLLMEFVDGVNLRQALRGGHFTPEQALAIVPPLCDALQFAHERGIVHRDIKPENLLLDKGGRIKIADFGIARMLAAGGAADSPPLAPGAATNPAAENLPLPSFVTADNAISGTLGYMAPEQMTTPQKVDNRADIYSLGVVFYEMLTGELPADRLQPPSRKVQIDVRLDEIVLRALEKTPELRYQTAAELRTQVETMVATPPPGSGNQAGATGTKVLSPHFLKVGRSTLVTPADLATARGQFLAYRTRGQLVLDDRQLTHTFPPALASAITVIPLAAIRDVSIGQYPRSMNPLGIDLLSVTYEEDGQRKQVLLSPMEGYFAMPRTWNARAAEWAAAIREAAAAVTGRAPSTTPSDQLGLPGSHIALLTMFLMPLVPLGVFLTCLTALTSPGASRHNTGLISLFVFGMAAFGFFWWLFTPRRRANSPPGSARALRPRLIALIAVLFGLAAVIYIIPSRSASGVASFACVPVGVSNNVVIVDVTTEVGRGDAELRAVLDGPPQPAGIEAALQDALSPAFAGTFVKPTPHAGNHPWRLLPAGSRQTWRLGFVLPNAALAKEAFDDLRPLGPLPAVAGRTHAGILFELGQPGGETYSARLQVTPPVTSADPDWVSVLGQSQHEVSTVTLNWDVLASRPGLARFSRVGSPVAVLKSNPQTKLFGVSVQTELTKIGTHRVLFVQRIGGSTTREELPGDFGELAAELHRTATFSAKSESGSTIELCQVQGQSFTVQVHPTGQSFTPPADVKVVNWTFPFVGVLGLGVIGGVVIVLLRRRGWSAGKVLLLSGGLLMVAGLVTAALFLLWGVRSGGVSATGGIRLMVVGIVGLFILLGVIALLVLLARKGGTAGKVAALVMAVPLLLLVLGVAALFGYLKVARDFGPGVGLVRLSPADEMVLESSHPVPAQQHPPGQVQQVQNGFRLSLPAAQLASFEFSIRQADDSWQPVPSLTALVATGEGGSYRDSLGWTLRRGNDASVTNQLWFWTVNAHEAGGHPLPQLADHGTHFTHHVPHGQTLDWWHLAVPPRMTMTPGTEQMLTLFRTFGTATARGEQLKEARIRIRCEPLPAGLPVSTGQHLVQAGLAAQALLEKYLPANAKREPGFSTSLPAGASAPNFATPQAAPDSSERATEPLALFTPVIDPSLGDASYRLISTLVKPRHVVLAEVALVDDRISTAHTISQLGFHLASADGTTRASGRVTWSIENVTEGEGAWIIRLSGEGGGAKFERTARLGSRHRGFADVILAPGQPENPDRGAETSLDAATTTWVAIRPERSHWVGPGEWSADEWNSLTLFEARDEKGNVQRRLRLKLLVRPMLADANVPWNGTLLRNGDWETDLELRALIGGPPAGQPNSETPKGVPDSKPAPRGEVHKTGIPAETVKLTPNAKPLLTERDYARVGVPTATLTPSLTNWSAEQNGLRLGMRVLDTAGWRIGGQVGVELWVANTGAQEVKFGHSPRTDAGLSVIARDKDGKKHSAEIAQYRGKLFYLPWLLPPSHSVKVMEFIVRFDPPGKPGELGRDAVFQLAPGDYTLHCVWTTPRLPNAPTTDWEGKLTSSDVEVKLLSAATSATAESEVPELPKQAATKLHRRAVKQPNLSGKDLVMTFEELRRDEKTSIATVKVASGGSFGSVGSAMFIARGAYDIARARGAAYFMNLKEWEAEGGARMYLIGFAPDKNVDPKIYFDLKEPLPADTRLLFLSVSAYERIFKDQP